MSSLCVLITVYNRIIGVFVLNIDKHYLDVNYAWDSWQKKPNIHTCILYFKIFIQIEYGSWIYNYYAISAYHH
jgi:hypothetical protein